MNLVLQTYNGSTITSYSPKIHSDVLGLDADVISVPRANDTVAYGGKSFNPEEFELVFQINQGGTARENDKETLGKLFNVRDSTLRQLVASDVNGAGTPNYYIECTPARSPEVNGQAVTVQMWCADPVWKASTQSSGTITVTAGAGTATFTNNGNVDTYPVISVTPTAAAGAYLYRQHVLVYNVVDYPLANYPFDVTYGGIDTGSLVGGTVTNQINQGGGVDGTATSWPIDTSVGGGLATTGGVFYVDSEQCSYTAITSGTITGVTRGINGTTGAAHANDAVMKKSYLMANGDDIMVQDSGVRVERFLGGTVATTANCKVWIPLDFEAAIELTLKTAIAGSGETAIEFKHNDDNLKALRRLPASGLLVLGNEVIAYTAKNVHKYNVTIANSGRGLKDTAAAAHAKGSSAYWMQHDIVLSYCNLNEESLSQTELAKPCFSLQNSTNTNWRWDSADSVFGDMAGLRSGGWVPSKPKGNYSDWYTGNEGTVGIDPFTDMGAQIESYQSGAKYKAETAQIWWSLDNSCGIESISSIGEKFKIASTTAWPTCRLQSSKNGQKWVNEWSEATPGTANTWTAWTHAGEALPNNTKHLRFEFFGAVSPVSGSYACNEVNLGATGSMGVSLGTLTVPQGTILARQSNAHLDFTLTNTTTGEHLTYIYPLAPNDTLEFDTEARSVVLKDAYMSPPELSTVRQEWLRLVTGANVLTYSDAYGGAANIVLSWRDRKNI